MTEKDLMDKCINLLKSLNITYIHRNNNIRSQKFRKNTDYQKGWPDIVIFFKGRCIFVELKVGNNNPTPEQVTFLTKMERLKYDTFIIYDYDNFLMTIKEYL